MSTVFYSVLGLIVAFVVVSVAWRVFNLPCPAWLGWIVERDNPLFLNNRALVIIDHLALMPGMKVLDLGCGPGRLTIPLAKQVGSEGEVTAFDIQEAMLKKVRARAQAENLTNIHYVQGGAGQGMLPSRHYDRVLLVTVLGEIPNRKEAMQEIYDGLKPGGILSITEVIVDPHFQPRSRVIRLAVSAGFVEHGFFGNRISFTVNFEKPGSLK